MRRRPRDYEIFSLSFLDVITCGFGAIVLLLLITQPGKTDSEERVDIAALLARTVQTEESINRISTRLEEMQQDLDKRRARNKEALLRQQTQENELEKKKAAAAAVRSRASELEQTKKDREQVSIRLATSKKRDEEVGGIPVDSDYVVFVLDTSGSMETIWKRVMQLMDHILDIHPEVKGFQIMNDNGHHLLPGISGRWLPGRAMKRQRVKSALRSWRAISNSSPVEGMEAALRYARGGKSVAIYVFGDDYSGNSYDNAVTYIDRLNKNPITGKRRAKIHAVGFVAEPVPSKGFTLARATEQTIRFSTLMREVTRRNGGTFLAMP